VTRRASHPLLLALVGLGIATLAGCAVGPDYARPELTTALPDRYGAGSAPVADADSAAIVRAHDRWWVAFGDTTLDRLVGRAVAGNQDLAAATARVLEARAALGGARADRWPAIEVGGTASRSKRSLQAFGGQGTIHRTLYDANLSTSYELDL
jgi:outer membrane protein TolC